MTEPTIVFHDLDIQSHTIRECIAEFRDMAEFRGEDFSRLHITRELFDSWVFRELCKLRRMAAETTLVYTPQAGDPGSQTLDGSKAFGGEHPKRDYSNHPILDLLHALEMGRLFTLTINRDSSTPDGKRHWEVFAKPDLASHNGWLAHGHTLFDAVLELRAQSRRF